MQVSLGKADTALQEHQSLAELVNTGSYNTVSKKIELKHDNTVLAEIDATAFIKDGMVDSVIVSNGYIVITFNTDAGKETIRIPVTDIFDPDNYYDKDDVDGLLAEKVDKETGKGLSSNDYTTADKDKLNALPTATELTQELESKANTANLATVATSGSYNDLTDKPSIPDAQVQSDWNETDTTSKAFIRNKPKIGGGTAADVSYDNTRTGLSATNVQDAIDEMADTNLYETVVLTVGSADSSFNPVGQTITVTLEDGSATQYTVPMSRQITFIVQIGMRYTISGTSTADYRVLPLSVKASIPTRYLTMRYIPIATGVFILQSDGNYYLREEYDAETMAEDAVGVLVLTSGLMSNNHGIVISKNSAFRTFSQANHSGARSSTEQLYNGYTTTQTMVSYSDSLASYCWGLSIQMDNGTLQGFLPAQIEGKQVTNNLTEVNNCLTAIGGTLLGTGNDYMTVNWNGNTCCGWLTLNSPANRTKCCPVYYYPISQ